MFYRFKKHDIAVKVISSSYKIVRYHNIISDMILTVFYNLLESFLLLFYY